MITGKKAYRAGLIGRTLTHSYSPQIHALLADYSYGLYELEPQELSEFFAKRDFDGVNVTIPYKKDVMSCLDYISPEAEKIGSVNTVKNVDGRLYGYNTDYYGFMYLCRSSGIDFAGAKVLLLGTGGASLTVNSVLTDLNVSEIISVSRTGVNNYKNLSLHADADIIVNTTPVGMYPDNYSEPLSLDIFHGLSGVIDLIYNPGVTRLMYDASCRGVPSAGGLSMLSAQAKKACEIFLGTDLPDSLTEEIISQVNSQMRNIVLVGMPGCGKSTAGKMLADMLGREFIDTDDLTAELTGMSVPDYILKYGEEKFRAAEHEAVMAAGKLSSKVIATGGGVPTREENYYPLHANGRIIYMRRDVSELARSGRPLSAVYSNEVLFRQRKQAYERFCDAVIDVNADVNITAENIRRAYFI